MQYSSSPHSAPAWSPSPSPNQQNGWHVDASPASPYGFDQMPWSPTMPVAPDSTHAGTTSHSFPPLTPPPPAPRPAAASSPLAFQQTYSAPMPAADPYDSGGWSDVQLSNDNGFGGGGSSGLQQRRGGGGGGGTVPAFSNSAIAPSATTSAISHSSGAPAAAAGLEAPRNAVEFLRQLLTPRLIVLLLALWLLSTLLALPLLLWHSETFGADRPPRPPQDDALFCMSAAASGGAIASMSSSMKLPARQKICLLCPANGRCGDDGALRCDSGFMRVYRECVPDNEENRRALSMKEAAIASLQRHAGNVQCSADSRSGSAAAQQWSLSSSTLSPADLTKDDLRRLALERSDGATAASAGQQQREADDRAWAIALRWIGQEATHLQQWSASSAAHSIRLLYVHTDSRELPRYRAVYPQRTFGCRMSRLVFSRSSFVAAGLGLLSTVLLFAAVMLLQFVLPLLAQSRALEARLVDLVRSDSFHDYDRRTNVHQPQAIAPLRAAHMARARAQIAASSANSSGVGKLLSPLLLPLRHEFDALLQRCVWSRAASQIARHEHVQSAVADFQYGPAPSWRWVGPAAVSRPPAPLVNAAASHTNFSQHQQQPLSASRRPQLQQQQLDDDDPKSFRHLHAL